MTFDVNKPDSYKAGTQIGLPVLLSYDEFIDVMVTRGWMKDSETANKFFERQWINSEDKTPPRYVIHLLFQRRFFDRNVIANVRDELKKLEKLGLKAWPIISCADEHFLATRDEKAGDKLLFVKMVMP